MPKSQLSDYEFDKDNWVISIFNSGSWMGGHGMMVIEGVQNTVDEKLFIVQCDIRAKVVEREKFDQEVNQKTSTTTNNNSSTISSDSFSSTTSSTTCDPKNKTGEKSFGNLKGFITEIRVFENDQYARDYSEYNASSYLVNRRTAKNIITAIKNDQKTVALSSQGKAEPMSYQMLGRDHLFATVDGGHNCVSYLLEKLEAENIDHRIKKSKPKKLGPQYLL